ncbi:MAG: S1/P1 nuclease [Verrucomicrobia bacterium]|nr:S1/P1 nuclease [Verrucomicrobiota bacterium]
MNRFFLIPILLSVAWSPTGHMVVGEVAKERLTNNARARCNELIALKVPPQKIKLGKSWVDMALRTGDFPTACCWADDVKSAADGPAHYFDIAFSADGTVPQVTSNRVNIINALTNAVAVLQLPKATKQAKAIQLRYLLHFVGDIHQPLHCATRVTDEHPGGDRGGNEFAVTGAANLHSYWDGGVGLLKTTIARPLTNDGIAKLAAIKAQCVAADVSPRMTGGGTNEVRGLTSAATMALFATWSQESHELAKSAAYADLEPHDTPSAAYVANAQRVVRERVALAGYRLAALLNEIFK